MSKHRERTRLARPAVVVLAVALLALAGVPAAASPPDRPADRAPGTDRAPGLDKKDTLRWVAPKDFLIGTAVAGGGHHGAEAPFDEEQYREILAREFNSVTHENWLKWDHLRPAADQYNFEAADEVVDFAQEHDQAIRGHTLVWHSQNPGWLEQGYADGEISDEEARDILKEHIQTVVGRYAGVIDRWDVVNEPVDDNAEFRESIWYQAFGGEDYIAQAFRWAHEADPDARLYINDYNVEGINAKSDVYYELAQDLLDDDVPIHGFAAQGHLGIQFGFPGQVQENLQRFDDLGLSTALTEVDIRMVLNGDDPTDEQLALQSEYFERLLEACLNVEGCNEYTIWGFNDAHSWVPGTFAGQGAPNIMWEDYSRKPAYFALQRALAEARPGGGPRYDRKPAYSG